MDRGTSIPDRWYRPGLSRNVRSTPRNYSHHRTCSNISRFLSESSTRPQKSSRIGAEHSRDRQRKFWRCLLLACEMLTLSAKEMNSVEDALIGLARAAGSFMLYLRDQDSSPGAMKPVIKRLTKFVLASNFLSLSFWQRILREMKRVLKVVKRISSQVMGERLFLSTFDKEVISNCHRQMTLDCDIGSNMRLSSVF